MMEKPRFSLSGTGGNNVCSGQQFDDGMIMYCLFSDLTRIWTSSVGENAAPASGVSGRVY
jgi:hypothetical protein